MLNSYADALRYIYAFADYERNLPRSRDEMHLAPMAALMDALGRPERRLRAVHVAGTKGKGSTAAMIEAILLASGYSVGTYTSPHLHTHRERYRIGGTPVTEETFTRSLAAILPAVETVKRSHALTTYTVITALAYQMFADLGVDWCVVEVGLGGRLDATNVILPALSIITSISMDHTEVLGDTITAIAREKAGIIKPRVPVVVGPQSEEAGAVLCATARERRAPLYVVSRLVRAAQVAAYPPERQCFRLRTEWPEFVSLLDGVEVCIPLLGEHQVDNALTASAAAAVLRSSAPQIDTSSILRGLAATRWPGRFEVVPGHPTVVIDGAHNADSVRRLVQTVHALYPDQRAVWVFGAGRSHDVGAMLTQLPASPVVLCSAGHPRALPLDELLLVAGRAGLAATAAASVEEAVLHAKHAAGPHGMVVVCGSLFVAAEARAALGLAHESDPVPS